MKKIIASLILSVLFLVVSSRVTFAQTNMCNQRCDLDSDCGSGYRCYVGVCRLDLCPAVSSCTCASSVTATPVVSPKPTLTPTVTAKPTATPKATSTPKPSITPKPTASVSAGLTHTPKTGASSLLMAGLAIVLFVSGIFVAGADVLLASHGKTAQEILSQRRSSRQ